MPLRPSRYEPRRFDLRALLLALMIQGALIAIFATYRFPVIRTVLQQPLVAYSIDLAPPPPPAPPEVERLPDPPRPIAQVHAPRPIVELPAPAPLIATTRSKPMPAPPPSAARAAPSPAPAPAPVSQIAAGDLSASMIHAPPPRYPRESRRLREQGTVVLELLLALDGTVKDIRVARSSGHARLDEAARGAVRRWRWSPTMRDGVKVQVRGTVEIPFVLSG
ncbi:MAG: energy transducer TonB [Sphingobium sp.]